jgi:hypothetical protein
MKEFVGDPEQADAEAFALGYVYVKCCFLLSL